MYVWHVYACMYVLHVLSVYVCIYNNEIHAYTCIYIEYMHIHQYIQNTCIFIGKYIDHGFYTYIYIRHVSLMEAIKVSSVNSSTKQPTLISRCYCSRYSTTSGIVTCSTYSVRTGSYSVRTML